MQDYNDNNNNIRRMPDRRPSNARPSNNEGGQPRRQSARQSGQSRPSGQPRSAGQGGRPVQGQQPRPIQGQPRPSGQSRRPVQGQQTVPQGQGGRPVQGQSGQLKQSGQPRQSGQGGRPVQGQPRPSGQPRRPVQGQQTAPQGQARRVQGMQSEPQGGQPRQPVPDGRMARGAAGAQNRGAGGNRNGYRNGNAGQNANRAVNNHARKNPAPHQAAKKKRKKIILFVVEIFLLLILVGALWVVNKAQKIQLVKIEEDEVAIAPGVHESIQQGSASKKGYRNIALFGVDSRNKQLDKSTRTDVIMVASINLDTKEVRLVSVYRDTWLNLSTDKYSKANAAYNQGGPKQAISMLNMNLDLDITDYVTVGFDALIDVIDAVGGIEINVTEAEKDHLNSYQISMVGKVVGKNAAGEDEYYAVPYVEYTPVEHAGLQKLNGLQATAYCRIRYVGDDFQRTVRQRTVLTEVAKKAMTLNPATLNKIAESVANEMATSLDMSEILSLLSGIASYKIGEQSGFPFEEYRQTGYVGKASVVMPVDLNKNVKELHKFLFDKEDYEPSETVKKCSKKISADTGKSYNGE